MRGRLERDVSRESLSSATGGAIQPVDPQVHQRDPEWEIGYQHSGIVVACELPSILPGEW